MRDVEEKLKAVTPAVTPEVANFGQSAAVAGLGQSTSEPDSKSILRHRLDYFTANITRRLVDIQRMRDRLEYCSEREAKFLLEGVDSRMFDGCLERL